MMMSMMMTMMMMMMMMMMMIRTNNSLILQILLLLLVHFSPQSDKTLHVFLAFLGQPHHHHHHHKHGHQESWSFACSYHWTYSGCAPCLALCLDWGLLCPGNGYHDGYDDCHDDWDGGQDDKHEDNGMIIAYLSQTVPDIVFGPECTRLSYQI